MNKVTGISFEEYMQIREKGIMSEMMVWGQLRGGFTFEGDFYYIGKSCYKVSNM